MAKTNKKKGAPLGLPRLQRRIHPEYFTAALTQLRNPSTTRTVLGLDPGVTNFAYGVTKFDGPVHHHIVAGKVANTVRHTMNDLQAQFASFLSEVLPLIELHCPDVVVIERFMNRGKFSGDQGEYVSMMIALLVDWLRRERPAVVVMIVQPGNWKTAYNRHILQGVKQTKQDTKPLDALYDFTLVEPHELDAVLMSHYGASLTRDEPPFSHLVIDRLAFVESIEAIAQGKKKRKRKELS